jgi:hypothetical protein
MSWEDQGRQQHGWFGSGKGQDTNIDDLAPDGQSLNQRIDAVISGSIAALPRTLRASADIRLDTGTRAQLSSLMVTWSGGADMDRTAFAGQFFGRTADDPVATSLRTTALTARLSGRPDALRDAAEHLASAILAVGLDRLHRFLDDAQARANDPARSRIGVGSSAVNINAAVKYLDNHAGEVSTAQCALAVRRALESGGAVINPHPREAKAYGPYLTVAGFREIDTKKYVPAKGDIVVIQNYEGGDPAGHIAMFNGSIWESDFKQRDMWAGPGYREMKPDYKIYRP